MKYRFFILLIFQLITLASNSQPCLPDGIEFHNQASIDSFQVNYPGCMVIEGDVLIASDDITNLYALNIITSIEGSLRIGGTSSLLNLQGLDNLNFIGGNVDIGYQGFWGGGTNHGLTSLTGLGGLVSVGGRLSIIGNDSLIDLDGLNSLISVDGDLIINNNPSLTSLNGLDVLVESSIVNLTISNNQSLNLCNSQSICDYLSEPGGVVTIYNNAPGCNNPSEIAQSCGLTISCLPFGDYYFSDQAEIDGFLVDYSGCTQLEGNVFIQGNEITNLSGLNTLNYIDGGLFIQDAHSLQNLVGLNNITAIGGTLSIQYNHSLASLAGLDNLDSVDGEFIIRGNSSLESMTGLDGLTSIDSNCQIDGNSLTDFSGLGNLHSIGGTFFIANDTMLTSISGLENLVSTGGGIVINNNDNLVDLTGLEYLTVIDGALGILENNSLTSLSGLENVNASSISDIVIYDNQSLSSCEAESICEYLADPIGAVNIYDNAPGCNSQEEVEVACAVGVEESSVGGQQSAVSAYPNPTGGIVNFQFTVYNLQFIILKVYNVQGLEVATVLEGKWSGDQVVRWDAGALPAGIYFYQLSSKDEGQVGAGKIVKY